MKLHNGNMDIWMLHPRPEIDYNLFFLFPVFLYFYFPAGSGFTWSRYFSYGLIWKFDDSGKSGDKRKFWTKVLSIFVDSLKYAWVHRPSPHFKSDNILVLSAATTSLALQYCVRKDLDIYFQLLNAMQLKETTMTRKCFCGQTVAPDCKQRKLLQYTFSFVCKLFKTISA